MKIKICKVLLTISMFIHLLPNTGYSQSSNKITDFSNWPKGCSPGEVGKRVAEHFVNSAHTNFGHSISSRVIGYPEVCTWYGALTFAKESKDRQLTEKLTERFEPLFGPDSVIIPIPDHVDHSVFGAIPLELYVQIKQQKYLDLGKRFADNQWEPPAGSGINPESFKLYEQGLTSQSRLWIDDMYMIILLQSQAYRTTGDEKYIDRAAKEMIVYLDSLQRPNGLFYHAPDVPFFWGRGNGWMAAGMTELLRSLPQDNLSRQKIMDGYREMMASLLKHQSPDGMWRQLIDDPESWPETSCTGMFAFAMITGVKNGWLDQVTYGSAARNAWLALISYLDENDDIRQVCEGTNKKNDRQYYLERKRKTGDMHGQAPLLWCASALLRCPN